MKSTGCSEVANTECPPDTTNDDSDKAESTRSLLQKNAQTMRGKLKHLLNTNKFQIFIMCLVIVDCLLVISELLIDLNVGSSSLSVAAGAPGAGSTVNGTISQRKAEGTSLTMVVTALHTCSLVIVAAFVVEMLIKVIIYGKHLIDHKMEIVDGFIIVITFALDLSLSDGTGAISGIGLLIALRLWRVTKILNGIVMSVKKHSDRLLIKEKTWRLAMEEELTRLSGRCAAQEHEIEALRQLLLKNGLELPANVATAAKPADNEHHSSAASIDGGGGRSGDWRR